MSNLPPTHFSIKKELLLSSILIKNNDIMPIQIGQYNTVKILRTTPHGVYVGSSLLDEVLLPQKYVPQSAKEGDEIEVFVYTDTEDRPVAVIEKPLAVVGEIAALKVVDITKFGLFLDWGLIEKHLFLPKDEIPKGNKEARETQKPIQRGDYIFVKLALDHKTNRVVGLGKLGNFIEREDIDLEEDEEVTAIVGQDTEIGFRCVIEKDGFYYYGMLYHNEIFGENNLQGKKHTAYIKKIREDGRIDIRLRKDGFDGIADQSTLILEKLKENNGFLPISDKSSPEEIHNYFNMSKKTFKKLIGNLYKKRQISIDKDGIRKTGK